MSIFNNRKSNALPHILLRHDLYGITSLLDYRKETAEPLCTLTQLLLRGESTLSEPERELIASYVSYLNECNFCHAAHSAATCMLPGGKKEWIDQMKTSLRSMDISPKIQALLAIAGKVQESGRRVNADDIELAKERGATDREIHDTVLIAAVFCLYNRYVDGLATRTPDDPSFYEALAKRITTRGYTMPSENYKPLKY